MTLLIAVSDAHADAELVAAARQVAAAAGWPPRAVHVHAPGGPELGSADLPDLELVDIAGDPAVQLSKLAAAGTDVDALALGLRTSAAGGLGGVTEAILSSFTVPLLLVRPSMRPITTLRRLLVPLEGSPSTSTAMARADDALCARGREIVMLHVVTGDTPNEAGSMPAPRIVDQEHYEWASWQEEFAMRFSQCPEGGRHRVSVRVGKPAPIIVEEADAGGAELIVLSWNGSFADGHGAVVKELLGTAPCPVLLVPSGAPAG